MRLEFIGDELRLTLKFGAEPMDTLFCPRVTPKVYGAGAETDWLSRTGKRP